MTTMARKCRTCSVTFTGGPRAYYCPACREERKRQTTNEYKRRKQQGGVRPLGSTDKCEMCGGEYIVEGGLQRFCPKCRPVHNKEYDRATSLAYYRENRDWVNPRRYKLRKAWYAANKDRINAVRRVKTARLKLIRQMFDRCPQCGKPWIEPQAIGGRTKPQYCARCQAYKFELNRRKRCIADGCSAFVEGDKKYCSDRCRWRHNKTAKRNKNESSGKCPQCGGDWIEPEQVGKKKPKHCRKCQEYYLHRYKEKKADE
ncbi:hypothetical protein M6D81_11715 [Paenibacillus sp. J5C_2022]|uniref:hypothetical protein n=1 Tax=Paenibacillus sp. J5C2022 TaxID=2977129 RepID=UPI0021D0F974|nr:hypothetical protein [Paenibacillus sp. J5C2022]MCU6709375.1 hypothetical protein [Paenibacillus sp. J5C2022]